MEASCLGIPALERQKQEAELSELKVSMVYIEFQASMQEAEAGSPKWQDYFVVLVIQPGVLHMLGKCSTTEPHLSSCS